MNLFKKSSAQPFSQMSRKIDNGITLNNLEMSAEKSKKPLFAMIVQFVIVLLGTLGAMYTFITFFDIVHFKPTLIVCSVIFSVLFTLLYSAKTYVKFTLPIVSLLFIVVIIVFNRDVAMGFNLVKNLLVSGINVAMGYSFPVDVFPYALEYAKSISIFLILVMFFLTALIGFAVVYRPNVFLVLLVTFPLFEVGMFFGIVPSYMPLAMLLACWTSVLAMQMASSRFLWRNKNAQFETNGNKHFYAKSESKQGMIIGTGVVMAVATLLVFGLTTFVLTQTNFTRPPEVDVLRADIKNGVDDLFYKDNDMDDSMGGINEGKLEKVDKRIVKNQIHLQAELPYSKSGTYLKGYVGINYTGSNWESLTNRQKSEYAGMLNSLSSQGLSPQRMDGLLLDAMKDRNETVNNALGQAKITNLMAKKNYSYLPYTSFLKGGSEMDFIEDSMTVIRGKDTYSVPFYGDYSSMKDYIETSPLRKNDQVSKAIQEYDKYVKDVYTQLPNKGLEEIKEMYSSLEYNSVEELGRNIRQYLATSTVYSTTSTRVPRGTDFVDFFLKSTKQGFCTHYATAATVMFRAAGVPARYVEGYLVFPSDYENSKGNTVKTDLSGVGKSGTQDSVVVNISDNNAHAWVEYYKEGVGWVPFEVTPGFYTENVTQVNPEPEPQPQPEEETDEPVEEEPEISPEDLAKQRKEQAIKLAIQIIVTIVIIAAFVALLWLLIVFRRSHANKKRVKSFTTSDRRQNVVNAYAYLKKVLSFAGLDNSKNHPYMQFADEIAYAYPFVDQEDSRRAMRTYLKASFSRQEITPEEMEHAVEFSKRFAMKLYPKLTNSQKITYLYIKNLY